MEIVHATGEDELAQVFVARLEDGYHIEFVESIQPPFSREEKWVLIVSTLRGCPVGCPICDAGGDYAGKLSRDEMMAQIDFLIRRRFPDGRVPVPKLKVQFARMGDPALNSAVLDVLEALPGRYDLPGLLPSVSTVAPAGCDDFFERLITVKDRYYSGGRFQMQFSLHTTDGESRRRLIPCRTWSLEQIAAYGDRFYRAGERRITLNFAPAEGMPLDPAALLPLFSPDRFFIKLTPINPTFASVDSRLAGLIDPEDEVSNRAIVESFEACGYDTLLSIGELRENAIGSNCGMYVTQMEKMADQVCAGPGQ
ncbi:radical SAM protein [Gemmatimonadota bacterium]